MPHRWLTPLLSAAIALILFAQSVAAAVDPRDVDSALISAVRFLYAQQKDDIWEQDFDKHGDQKTGQTALVVHALLSAGESHQDPRIAKAIEYLKKTPTTGVYALGVRCQVWAELPQSPDVRSAMLKDAKILLNSIQHEGKIKGFYGYNPDQKSYSLSRGHYAVLGVWAAAQSGQDVPNSYWQFVERAWITQQDASGGWSYKGKEETKYPTPVTPGMTADGIGTLFITQDYLHADEAVTPRGNIKNAALDKAMAWMTSNFKLVSDDKKFSRDYPYSTLYAIERIGAASGLKYFGDIDWYDVGAARLLRNQKRDGSWPGDYGGMEVSGTCFGVLFLSRGRAPVVMNKLAYDIDGKTEANWNQRPRDIANITRWIGKQTERQLNWQITNLSAPPADLLDAPILFISGNQELKFTKEQAEKLRAYIESGGMIFANADGGAAAFINSFKKLGQGLFPQYEFRQLPADHVLLSNQLYPMSKWKRKPAVLGLSNGVRELMLIVPDIDLSRAWQVQETTGKEELFQLAGDLFLYAVDKKETHFRGGADATHIDSRIKPKQTAELARIKYAGNWDPEPGGWKRLAALLNNRDRFGLKISIVDADKEPFGSARIAHITGAGKFKFSDAARAAIKQFVEGGGTLIVDAAGGSGEFAQSAEAELAAIFGTEAANQLRAPLPADLPIYRPLGKAMPTVSYRSFARAKLAGELKGPRLRAIKLDNRLAVIYSPEDLSAGLAGATADGIIGYDVKSATELMRAIVLHVAPK